MSSITGFNINGKGLNTRLDAAPLHLCPKCSSYTGHRIANAKFVDRTLFWMPLRRYQCDSCSHRFYILAR